MAINPEQINTLKTETAPPPVPPAPAPSALGTETMTPPMFKAPTSSRQGMEQQAKLIPQQSQANAALFKAQSDAEIGQKGAQAKAAEQTYEGLKTQIEKTQSKEKDFPFPEFHPTEENMLSLGSLFSLVSVLGPMLGGSGKAGSLAALTAMTGMMQGWKQGRKDLYIKEKSKFDTEMARVKQVHDDLRKDLEDYYKLAPYEKEKAFAKLQEIAQKAGQSSVIAAMVNKGDIDGLVKLYESSTKVLADKEIKAATKSAPSAALPKDKETIKNYQSRYQMIKNIDDVESLLKDPKYRNVIDVSTGYVPDVLNNLKEKFPELSQKLSRIQAMEFDIGGKALTLSEQKILGPIYNWRGLTPKALEQKLTGVKSMLQDNLGLAEATYPGFVPLRQKFDAYYDKTGKVPEAPLESTVSSEDQEALNWANTNPSDPRAIKIKQRLGVQ